MADFPPVVSLDRLRASGCLVSERLDADFNEQLALIPSPLTYEQQLEAEQANERG